ncbi:hypothetical protein D0C16_20335 [Cellvibrio sp. KY-GH-1]|nr:hypothetical protein D0C16_20335 [Cellvibrio sp. KY-GH-1]
MHWLWILLLALVASGRRQSAKTRSCASIE